MSAPASCDPFCAPFRAFVGGWGATFELLTRVLFGAWFWSQGLPIRLRGRVEIGAPRPRRRRGVAGDCRRVELFPSQEAEAAPGGNAFLSLSLF